ncbi:MAG: exo-alpha-sialidase [Bryobacterales bacterium]|nr:exo-alpha-sialidase [Bryobacterales bacterium]
MTTWNRLTPGRGDDQMEAATVRTKDGVLHVFWRTAGPKRSLMHVGLGAADGKPTGAPVAIAENWDGFSLPKAVLLADGTLQVFFSGQRGSADRNDPYNAGHLYTATSKDGGASWTLAPGAQSPGTKVSYLAAAPGKESKPVAAYVDNGAKVLLQDAFGPAAAVETTWDGECCAYHVQLAQDADSGEIWAAWFHNGRKAPGVYVRAVKPAPGEPQLAPGSGPDPNQQTALAPRVGAPGLFLAYFNGPDVKLWNARGGEALNVTRVDGIRRVWLAAGNEGRYWLVWVNGNHTASALRTNKALSRFSKPYTLGTPASGSSFVSLVGDGAAGPLDAVAHTSMDGPDKAATFHARVLPLLEVSGAADGVTVTDVGDPVEGVDVTVAGKTVQTDVKGFAAHPLTPGVATPVQAARKGYENAAVTITLPKPPAAAKAKPAAGAAKKK